MDQQAIGVEGQSGRGSVNVEESLRIGFNRAIFAVKRFTVKASLYASMPVATAPVCQIRGLKSGSCPKSVAGFHRSTPAS
jgi:hypothetical protein